MTKNQMDEVKRHFNVVAEGLQHEIRLIAEGHEGVVHKSKNLDAKLDHQAAELNEKIGWVAESVQAARTESAEWDARLDAKIDAIGDELKTDIAAVGDKVDGHQSRIRQLERRAA